MFLFIYSIDYYLITKKQTAKHRETKRNKKETKRNKKKQIRLYLFRYNSLNSNKITPFAPKRNKIFASRQFLLHSYSFPIYIGGHKKTAKVPFFKILMFPSGQQSGRYDATGRWVSRYQQNHPLACPATSQKRGQ